MILSIYYLIIDYMSYQLHIISLYHRRIFVDDTIDIQCNMSV